MLSNLRFFFLLLSAGIWACQGGTGEKAGYTLGDVPVTAPFGDLDSLSTNDWWNRAQTDIINLKVSRDSVIAFGIYTVSEGVLKLSAQLYPLYPDEDRTVRLELQQGGEWEELAAQQVNDLGWMATFRLENWDDTQAVPYRLRHGKHATFQGLIRANPIEKEELLLAGLSCNSNKDRGLRENYVRNISHQDPDLLFFAGDQSYDHLQHTAAWLKFGLQFRELFRDRPCITIPDDHDIGQGNLWGEGGKKSEVRAGHDGGYFYHPEYVKMVERAQTSHLPDPYDPTPVEQGIGVYYTNLQWGGVDFAIIEDRKFKSGPAGKIPQQGPRPDHIRDPDYDPKSVDVEGLTLLGGRQLEFLEAWGQSGNPAFRAVLSQTGFCGGAHLHGQKDNRLHADMDSNGWPQTRRRKALERIRAANAVHIAGDQHLATVIQHGLDQHGDGPWAFVVPAIVNNYYSRWWWPLEAELAQTTPHHPDLPWTGNFLDGFDNKIAVHAYANPDADSAGAGYGLVRFNKAEGTVTFECWPRYANVTQPDARQFPGWPKVIALKSDDSGPQN